MREFDNSAKKIRPERPSGIRRAELSIQLWMSPYNRELTAVDGSSQFEPKSALIVISAGFYCQPIQLTSAERLKDE
ncbi:MAG: hypothetical protein FIA97_07555 [Methylococcaceae bacterium]|nr:hypothetical protein [Methylococcaceae bacterium]